MRLAPFENNSLLSGVCSRMSAESVVVRTGFEDSAYGMLPAIGGEWAQQT